LYGERAGVRRESNVRSSACDCGDDEKGAGEQKRHRPEKVLQGTRESDAELQENNDAGDDGDKPDVEIKLARNK